MQNPNCHFSMDEPIGSFSPVQGAMIRGIYADNLVEAVDQLLI